MSKHTPGPWEYHYSRSDPNDEWIIGAAGFAPVLAFVVRDEESPPPGAVVEANARLMAAAPEMYEVVRAYATDERCQAIIARVEGRQP